ncbi:hypothetical protein RRG08_047130 [Elysia crispata]|uniref:Uncharacterized protein n=1 Tax=Elysia crispata TaxID=231223 RepID=A0AAE1E270_9GAST|nr:hypothetical protein RRG08_047130 [Elysia crispata]
MRLNGANQDTLHLSCESQTAVGGWLVARIDSLTLGGDLWCSGRAKWTGWSRSYTALQRLAIEDDEKQKTASGFREVLAGGPSISSAADLCLQKSLDGVAQAVLYPARLHLIVCSGCVQLGV